MAQASCKVEEGQCPLMLGLPKESNSLGLPHPLLPFWNMSVCQHESVPVDMMMSCRSRGCKEAPAAELAEAGDVMSFGGWGGVSSRYTGLPAPAVARVTAFGQECAKLILSAGTHFSGVCS